MARRKTPRKRKSSKRSRWIWVPKLLLLAGCVGLVIFIGIVFMMDMELRRVGLFTADVKTEKNVPLNVLQSGQIRGGQEVVEEVTPEERKILETILER